jgi:hypothetical protein
VIKKHFVLCSKEMPLVKPILELAELLYSLASSGQHAENVESDGLAKGSALANSDLITFLDTEGGRNVGGEILVPLFVSGVLLDEVEVFAPNDNGAVHLRGNDRASENTATDRNEPGEGALLINVSSLNRGFGGPES